MNKILLIAPMTSVHEKFNIACINALKSLDCEIHLAANFYMDNHSREYADSMSQAGFFIHNIPFVRSSFFKNIKCIKQLRNLFVKERFMVIHSHTETGGLLTRIAMRFSPSSLYVYTPHGMSFWDGSSFLSQALYKPIEKWICGRMDATIAINAEEFAVLKQWNKDKSYFIHGVGVEIDILKHPLVDKRQKKRELGIPEDCRVLLSVGELNDNKNHTVVLDALSKINGLPDNILYLICGKGINRDKLLTKAQKLGLADRLVLLGFRNDIIDIFQISDYFVFPSFHEGLPVSVMQAMAAGLPIICSKIRGNVDLIADGQGGFLYLPTDIAGFSEGLNKIIKDDSLSRRMGEENRRIVEKYSIDNVEKEIFAVYNQLLNK